MAVMQKNTYKLFHNDQCIVPEDYVEIDEMIAPTIQVLNQKGYTTVFCCAGHPLDNCLWRDAQIETGYRETGIPLRTYIMFAEGITVPCLPPDFETDTNSAGSQPRIVIEKWYQITSAFENQYYEKMRRIFETMQQLYQWALDLPEFDPDVCDEKVRLALNEKVKLPNGSDPKTFERCKEKIAELDLEMKLTNVEYDETDSVLRCYFIADKHPDLRELVKSLSQMLNAPKIEFRQVKE